MAKMLKIKIDKLIRARRRTISLSVAPDATLVVRAPRWVSLEYLKSLIFQKRAWILKKQQQILENGGPKSFSDDEEFFYLGQKYKLKIVDAPKIEIGECLYFPEKFLVSPKIKMMQWYGQRTRELVADGVRRYSALSGLRPRSVKVTSAARRWGSCSAKDSLNFSWRLAMAPPEVIDYVAVHELAHLREKNHSAKFWAVVLAMMPDYKMRRKWLRENEGKLTIY